MLCCYVFVTAVNKILTVPFVEQIQYRLGYSGYELLINKGYFSGNRMVLQNSARLFTPTLL